MFNFAEQASEDGQDRIRRQILDMPGVENVGRINPDARNPRLRRMWFAEVADDKAAASLVQQLREYEEIQVASLPQERGLA